MPGSPVMHSAPPFRAAAAAKSDVKTRLLRFAPGHRRGRRATPGRSDGAEHLVDGDRVAEALECLLAERARQEATAQLLERLVADHDAARLGETLQSRGDVRRIAERERLRGGIGADLAHQHRARVDADARLDRNGASIRLAAQRGQRPLDLERRSHRAFGVVLVGRRIAEVGEHAIAEELGHVAVEAADRHLTGPLVLAQDVAEILGVELTPEHGRTDEVAEDHRERTPLAARLRRGRASRCRDGLTAGRAEACRHGERFAARTTSCRERIAALGAEARAGAIPTSASSTVHSIFPKRSLRDLAHAQRGRGGSTRPIDHSA